MKPGDVVLIALPQPGSAVFKFRPALVLSSLPGHIQTILVCGISVQVQHLAQNWDELIQPGDADYPQSGLHAASVVRLSYLYGADTSEIKGIIGRMAPARLDRLRQRLSDHLKP